ncbi:MAG TPA: alpha-L-fucosidase [bacterium]
MTYEATVESVRAHLLPSWYDDAKFGIFIHWSLFSVPAWAPTTHTILDVGAGTTPMWNMPYVEFYSNWMNVPGSPTWAYHRQTYGANYAYENFVPQFNAASRAWDPQEWAALFKQAGARYVVPVSKHHEGFLLWPAKRRNPFKPNYVAQRNVIGELAAAVRAEGMRFGVYYSGAFDWTFAPHPMRDLLDSITTVPQSQQYVDYITDHFHDLIDQFQPAVLWNDIGTPGRTDLPALFARYYNAVPDGVVDDRYRRIAGLGLLTPILTRWPFRNSMLRKLTTALGGKGGPLDPEAAVDIHCDFLTPEYTVFPSIVEKKWETTRGLGKGFGYNRAEPVDSYLTVSQVVHLLVDAVSKNGNMLLNVGPMADGTIPDIQRDRLAGLGAWLATNGEAIYGTRTWGRAEGIAQTRTGDEVPVRFTRNGVTLYATLLAAPAGTSLVLKDLGLTPTPHVFLLGVPEPLAAESRGRDLAVTLPSTLPTASVAAQACSLKLMG